MHSVLAPSSAARRVACPGSRELESKYPQRDGTDAAQEGIDAHKFLAEILTAYARGDEIILPPTELGENIKTAFNHVDSIVKKQTENLYIEKTLPIIAIHDDCFGTPDIFYLRDGELHIWDYKHGHSPVEVFENYQLLEYAAGAMHFLYQFEIKTIFLHIIQPRAYHVDGIIRTWNLSIGEALKYFKFLNEREKISMRENAPLIPSSQCKYCSARASCSALRKTTLNFIEDLKIPRDTYLPPDELGKELSILLNAKELLDARITGLEQQALQLIADGKTVRGFVAEQTIGREKWVGDINEIISLADTLNIDIKKPVELITPKQAVNAGLPREIVNRYSETPRGMLKLKKLDAAKYFKRK